MNCPREVRIWLPKIYHGVVQEMSGEGFGDPALFQG